MKNPINPQAICGNTADEVIRLLVNLISVNGVTYESSTHSMNKGLLIQELFNTTICLSKPRNRLFSSDIMHWNPGLAAARFLYFLSGSSSLDHIAYYSSAVRMYTDDGETIPGSSYGSRVFGTDSQSQFKHAAEIIKERPNTKRVELVIYERTDLARAVHSKDIPCASSITFMPRGTQLHMTVSMRANDALKLLPFNIFEFSLLHECMAAYTGYELGVYHHTAVSSHLRGIGVEIAQAVVSENGTSEGMLSIGTFNDTIREIVMQHEQDIRGQHARSLQTLGTFLVHAQTTLDATWADLLITAACEGYRTQYPDQTQHLVALLGNSNQYNYPLMRAYQTFLWRALS